MEQDSYFLKKSAAATPYLREKNTTSANASSKISGSVTDTGLIRFEEKKESYIWAHPDEIIFVKSADHYVKSLINRGKQKKWMIRHCTLKELFVVLPPGNFMRLNKFYLINRNHFLRINENEKLLYLNDDFSIPVPHRISRYVLDILKK
jgi:DNA-binding LytR/AlgR family response regulator